MMANLNEVTIPALPTLPPEYLRPELMVIGDSLAQGCRSLSVQATYCRQSWPARVATSQGWTFRTPDFPRPILFDLEQEIRLLGDVIQLAPAEIRFQGLVGRFLQNLRAWLANKKESAFLCFDNLGLSGAQPYDLYTRTAASSNAEIAKTCPNGPATSSVPYSDISTLHLGINGRYVLNPSQNPAFENLTPLMWVQARQPKRLFIQIGHNNGLYAIGADADPQRLNFTQDNPNGDKFFDSFKTIAKAVAEMPDSVEAVLVALLPKVGTVANLRPNNNTRSNGYADYYSPVFSTSKTVLPGATLAQVDQQIADANSQIVEIFRQAAQAAGRVSRLTFLDAFKMFETIDYKNTLDVAERISIDQDHVIDNNYLAGSLVPALPFPLGQPPLKKVINHGGFQSIDGMHPTGCGYAVVASWAMKLLDLPNNDLAKLLDQSLMDDPLVHDVPLKLDLLTAVLTQFKRTLRAGSIPFPPRQAITEDADDPHLIDVVRLAHQVIGSRE
ncbi:MAG: hypothetical protein WB586_05270 [Chthoniobacterales bacterium]